MFDLSEYCSMLIYARPGSGKTNFVKFFLNKIPYKHLYVITSSPHEFDKYNGRNCTMNWDYEIDGIETFLSKKGVKVVVLDDFLHLAFSGHIARSLRRLLSTCRHTQTYVISSTQNLTCIGKIFRYASKMFLTGNIDDDSIELLAMLSGMHKNELREICLKKYEFVLAQSNGDQPKKIKLKLQ